MNELQKWKSIKSSLYLSISLLIFIGIFLSIGLTKALIITIGTKSPFLKLVSLIFVFSCYLYSVYFVSKSSTKTNKTHLKTEIINNTLIFIPFLLFFFIPLYLPFDCSFIKNYFSFYLMTQKGNLSHIFLLFFISLILSFLISIIKKKGLSDKYNKLPNLTKILTSSVIIIILVAYILIFFLLSLWHYFTFKTSEDFGVFLQLFYTTSKGLGFFETSITNYPKSLSIFADHNSPILLFLYPIIFLPYAPKIYLFMNVLILTFAIIPMWKLMQEKFIFTERLLISFAFLCSPYYIFQHLNGMSMEMFSPLLIFLIYYFLRKEKFVQFVICFILCLMIKEDLAFTLILFSVLTWKYKRNKKWIITIITLSIISLFLSFFIVIPHFRQESSLAKLSTEFGDSTNSLSDLVFYQLKHPIVTIKKLFKPNTLIYLYLLFVPGLLFLPFITLESIMLLPSLLINIFLVSWATNITSKHSLVIYGVLFISVIASLEKLKNYFKKTSIIPITIVFLILGVSIACIVVWSLNIAESPREYFRSELAAIQMIPNNANVSAPVSMISRLGHRVHLIPSMLPDKIAGFDEGKEYILLDEHFPSKDFDYKKQIHDMINSDSTEIANYDLIYNKEGIYLFRKK